MSAREVPEQLTTGPIDALDVARALPYGSSMPGLHAHGNTEIPTDGCALCDELKRRRDANDRE